MLTVNSPFRCRNSLVPSRGSTSQNRRQARRASYGGSSPSSLMTGTAGSSAPSPAAITACDARSAAVTGLRSALSSTAPPAA
jgi:hypothetical protein